MTQFPCQSRSIITSQFINGISPVLQKLLKLFIGITIFTFALLILSAILDLN